jgi:hypothetical protein
MESGHVDAASLDKGAHSRRQYTRNCIRQGRIPELGQRVRIMEKLALQSTRMVRDKVIR